MPVPSETYSDTMGHGPFFGLVATTVVCLAVGGLRSHGRKSSTPALAHGLHTTPLPTIVRLKKAASEEATVCHALDQSIDYADLGLLEKDPVTPALDKLVTPPVTSASAHGVTTTGCVKERDGYLAVESSSETSYNYYFVNGLFDFTKSALADEYRPHGRCLVIMDKNLESLYGERMSAYFDHHELPLTIASFKISENVKTMRTAEAMIDAMQDFGLNRQEPVLVMGGGLLTDMAGFACSMMRRNTPYVRVPTSLIGLIDASIAIKVAVNHADGKNKLGAFHAHQAVFLDTAFLATLPAKEIRVGMAEIIKISVVEELQTFELLEKYCEELVETKFGHVNPDGKFSTEDLSAIKEAGSIVLYRAIHRMLELESPNLQELSLDRAIAFGHTWSPEVELVAKYRYGKLIMHGHAVAMDMALSMTLAHQRGLINEQDRDRVHSVISKVGLMLDHPAQWESDVMCRATEQITQTRNGKLRAAVPVRRLGQCTFLNDVEHEELMEAVQAHKTLAAQYPRGGLGTDFWIEPEEVSEERFVVTPTDRIQIELAAASRGRTYKEVANGIGKVARMLDKVDEVTAKYSSQPSQALKAIATETASTNALWAKLNTVEQTPMQVEAEIIRGQSAVQLLKVLAQFGKVETALDVGTFTGSSALGMAEALPADGRVVTIEREQVVADMARKHFEASEHATKIDSRVGAVSEELDGLAKEGMQFDLVFVDADKPSYKKYFDQIMEKGLLKVGGLLAVYDTMYKGEELVGDALSANGQGVQDVNEAIFADTRLTNVMLPLGDGITVAFRNA